MYIYIYIYIYITNHIKVKPLKYIQGYLCTFQGECTDSVL